ncbi:unnamed protein product [Ectocarpus sp. 4 AP-2014]
MGRLCGERAQALDKHGKGRGYATAGRVIESCAKLDGRCGTKGSFVSGRCERGVGRDVIPGERGARATGVRAKRDYLHSSNHFEHISDSQAYERFSRWQHVSGFCFKVSSFEWQDGARTPV